MTWQFYSWDYTLGILKYKFKRSYAAPMFIAALFIVGKCWTKPKCPFVNESIKKLLCIDTVEYYTAERKKELLPFMTAWIGLESIMLSEMSQVIKDKYHMISSMSGT